MVSDVDCAVGEAPCLTPPDYDGFEFVEVEVVFWGCAPIVRHHRVRDHARDRSRIYLLMEGLTCPIVARWPLKEIRRGKRK